MAEKQRNERRTSVTVMLNPGRELDDRITELAAQAPPFWKNSNLFKLYLLMIPGCLFPAITLGFDAAMMNGLQAVPRWDQCKSFYL